MTQNNRPVQPGGMPPRGPVPRPSAAPQSRPVMPQRPVSRPAPQVRPAAPRPAQPRPAASPRLPSDFGMIALVCALVFIAGLAAQIIWPNGFSIGRTDGAVEASAAVSEIHGSGPIRINELMGSNKGTIVDEDGLSSDWLEIANVSAQPVNLAGYSLGKNERAATLFTFPEHVIEPGECVIVYASSNLQAEAGKEYHAPFKLSSQGGSLMLFNASGTAIDSVNYPSMSPDMSYVRESQSSWLVNSMTTPGMPNTAESYQLLRQPRSDAGVELTEIVSSSTKYGPDENGVYHDYIEVHNVTGAAIDMSGWFLTDDPVRLTKWRLPDGFVLQAGEYRIIHASGLDRANADHPHTNFGLSSEGETVMLVDGQGRVVEQVQFDLLKDDQAWVKDAGGNWATGTPSPTAAN